MGGGDGWGRRNLNISGTIKNLTCEPRMYTWSRWDTRPSRAVTVMSLSCTFILSSAALCRQLPIRGGRGGAHTFDQLPAEDLAGGQLESADVALDTGVSIFVTVTNWKGRLDGSHLGLVQQLDWNPNATHDCLLFPWKKERYIPEVLVVCWGEFREGG